MENPNIPTLSAFNNVPKYYFYFPGLEVLSAKGAAIDPDAAFREGGAFFHDYFSKKDV